MVLWTILDRIVSIIEIVQTSGAHKIECCVCPMDGVTLDCCLGVATFHWKLWSKALNTDVVVEQTQEI